MIDQRFMQSLADDMLMPPEEAPAQDVLLAAGPVASDMDKPFIGTRLNVPRAGQPQPTRQDREKLAIGLLDSLAGALRGGVIEGIALPGNIRSIIDMINKEGAEKYLGPAIAPTTEDIKQAEGFNIGIGPLSMDVPIPPVLGADVPNREERQKVVEAAEEVGAFLPAPGIPEAVKPVVKAVKRMTKKVAKENK